MLCFGLKASGNHLALAIVHEISDISFLQNHLDFEMQKLPYIYNEYHLEKALFLQFVLVPVFLLDALELDHGALCNLCKKGKAANIFAQELDWLLHCRE